MQRFNLEGRPAGLQECPVAQQLVTVDFGLRFDEPLLRARERATDALDGVEREDRLQVLIHRMEVWPVVRCAQFRKHPNDDSEESRNRLHRLGIRPVERGHLRD